MVGGAPRKAQTRKTARRLKQLMKISHKIVIGFAVPIIFAGILSHIYMARCQETSREQERAFLSALTALTELERMNPEGGDAAPAAKRRLASDEVREGFSLARNNFSAFMRLAEYSQYAFAVLLLFLAFLTVKAILIPLRNLGAAAARLREGYLGVRVPVRSRDELGALAEAFNSMSEGLKTREEQLKRSNRELEEALKNLKTIYGLLPICAHCKKIRDEKGGWEKLESYFYTHSEIKFSHGICPDCAKKYYPQFAGE